MLSLAVVYRIIYPFRILRFIYMDYMSFISSKFFWISSSFNS